MKPNFRLAATAAAFLAGVALAVTATAEEPHDSHPQAAPRGAPKPQGHAPAGPVGHGPSAPVGHGAAPTAGHGPVATAGHGPALAGRGPTAPARGPAGGDAKFDRRSNPQQWQSVRSSWHGAHPIQNAPWRGNSTWWRGRPEFRGYEGERAGFWFAPGFGYLNLPATYRGHHWGVGEYMPAVFWEYRVADWTAYGLYPAPYGCAWVWIEGGVALIDLTDGYVMDVEYGLY